MCGDVPVDIGGGSGGVHAQFDDLSNLSQQYRAWSDELDAMAGDLRARTSDPSFIRSSRIAVDRAATRDALVAAVLTGPRGLPVTATDLEGLCRAVGSALISYIRTDGGLSLKDHSSLGDSLLGFLSDAVAWSPGMLPVTLYRKGQEFSRPSAESAAGVDSALTMLSGAYGGYENARLHLASQYDDGHPTVSLQGGVSTTSAGSMTGQLDKLAQVSSAPDGGIGIELKPNADGTRSVTVFVPGVRDWDLDGAATGVLTGPLGMALPLPIGPIAAAVNSGDRVRSHDVRDVGTTLRAIGGETTSYEQGVLEAMRQAGVRPDDHVMLVGHSLGGVIAANVAAHTAATGEFHVTHVLTAGSPNSRALQAIPKSIKVMALENSHDVVPTLDRSGNPRTVNTTTVTGDGAQDSYGDAHSVRATYEPIAEAAQDAGNASVQDFLDSAGEYYQQAPASEEFYSVRRDF